MTLTDEEARRCSRYLYGAARNIDRQMDINDVQDIIQETMLRALLYYDRGKFPDILKYCSVEVRSVVCYQRLRSKKFGRNAEYVKEREPQWYDESVVYRRMVNGTLKDILDPMQFDLCEVLQKRLLLKKFREKYKLCLNRYYDYRRSVLEYLLMYELTHDS